jgi:hypothetical protein
MIGLLWFYSSETVGSALFYLLFILSTAYNSYLSYKVSAVKEQLDR